MRYVFKLNIFFILNKLFLSIMVFIFFSVLVQLNYTINFYQDLILCGVSDHSTFLFNFDFITSKSTPFTTNFLVQVYAYPFMYVFLVITVLSIVFCLTYNTDELSFFMFYCVLILLAGYILFFTDSFILFFLAYEMLLVPSFFILYKFAKTRRCVEAAYLMFF